MRFEQTRDILRLQVADYHNSVSRLYQDFSAQQLTPRNRLMVEYLIEHEARLALAIHEFMVDAPHGALDYWFKNIERPFPVPDAATLSDNCCADLDRLVGAAIHYKTDLISFYDHLLQQCDAAEVVNLFQLLRGQEEKAMKRFIRHAQGLADL